MNIEIKPIRIEDNEANKVTSDKIFVPRKIKDANGNYLFHPDGIFSERIFGKFNKCRCGKLTKPGYCDECGCRVINKRKVPNFYIEMEFDLPNTTTTFTDERINMLLNYKAFLYENKVVEFDVEKDYTDLDQDKILIGKDAVLALGVTEEEYNNNVHNKISVPHTSYRQITIHGDKYYLGDINLTYINIIKTNNLYSYQKIHSSKSKLYELNLKNYVVTEINKLYDVLFQILAKNHRNVVDNELKGQPETGVIRAVMTNNFSLDEDDLLIGSYFISTLYPYLYKKYSESGEIDIDGINKELKKEKYLVLFNRQPTIGAKSIIAMHPIFSKSDAEKYVIQANPIIYDGLAGDVDGDSLNVIALYTKESCEEAEKLLPSKNYIEGSNESIRNGLPEDFVYVKTRIENGEV